MPEFLKSTPDLSFRINRIRKVIQPVKHSGNSYFTTIRVLVSCILLYTANILHAQINQDLVDEFVERFAGTQEIPLGEVREILNQAEYMESIITKINRPAEKMSWHKYRAIFMTDERIAAGAEFWKENEQVLAKVSEDTGIPSEIILGIIGVETFFGRIKGDYRVLDALYTLSFAYPRRAKYFQSELENFLILTGEENINLYTAKGSYAGAMGYCQFMPSSYRAYAISFNQNETKDLLYSPEDAIASVANYLKVHHWQESQPIVQHATRQSYGQSLKRQSLKPKYKPSYYADLGYNATTEIDQNLQVTLIELQKEEEQEYWLAMHNFYVITRYNHSALYAMAVYQLAEAIKQKK